MLRTIGGIVAGIIVFVVTVVVLELIAHQIFPGQRTAPSTGILLFVALAYFLSSLAGGVTAGRISRQHWTVWVIAILVAAGAAYTLATMPHPLWMQIASIAAPLLGGLVASRMVPRHVAVPPAETGDAAL